MIRLGVKRSGKLVNEILRVVSFIVAEAFILGTGDRPTDPRPD